MYITLYSTCQGDGIRSYLKYYFKKPHHEINIIHNYKLVLNKENINYDLLKKTNIFIYQEMPPKWGKYSTDSTVKNNILTHLNDNCIKITIPYVFIDWLWSLSRATRPNSTAEFNEINNNRDYKYINKEVIINLKENGHNLKSILHLYDTGKIDFNYKKRMTNCINILKEKEKTCDVKISDFIMKHYRKYNLMNTINHPNNIVIEEMSKQILKILKIDHKDFHHKTKDNKFRLKRGSSFCRFSTYDLNFHKFEFKIITEDKAVKQLIKEIYEKY